MATVYNQALAHRFGTALTTLLTSGQWTTFEAAVAWVRRSGMRHLLPALEEFLAHGGIVRFVVGIDIENTSVEGLRDLLSLSKRGNATTYVHHNEAGVIFHPKVYLFRNETQARLIIGSNNITEAGLYRNTEAGLQIDAPLTDKVIKDMRTAIKSWRDPSHQLARKLDSNFLAELVKEGYVADEQAMNQRRRHSCRTRRADTRRRRPRVLFGSRSVTAPIAPGGRQVKKGGTRPVARALGGGTLRQPGHPTPVVITNVLLMKIRPHRGGTQIQLPVRLRKSSFLAGHNTIVSGHDGTPRVISPTRPKRAKGRVNTYKVEIRETKGMLDPVLRIDRSPQELVYYVYESSSPQGQPIRNALEDGRRESPPATVVTKRERPDRCTWYRFI